MNSEQLKVYENPYFHLNRTLLSLTGLWPYASQKNKIMLRIFMIASTMIFCTPHFLAINMWCGTDVSVCCENISAVVYLAAVTMKYVTTIICEEKLKSLYELLARNWLEINDPKERQIMAKYAKEAKEISWGYIVFVGICALIVSQFCLGSVVLDFIMPLNESRPRNLVTRAEYIIDTNDYFYEIYVAYCYIALLSVGLVTAIDTMYSAVVHQSLGMFSIVKHRLLRAISNESDEDAACTILISAISIHKQGLHTFAIKILSGYLRMSYRFSIGFSIESLADILHLNPIGFFIEFPARVLTGRAVMFINVIESSYGLCILVLTALTLLLSIIGSIAIIEQAMVSVKESFRMSFFGLGIILHLLFVTWPGQKVIDDTKELFISTYMNNWYSVPQKAKKLLLIMMTRCLKPSTLTAGGIYEMNFENVASVLRTAASYITVAVSLRT